MASCFLQLSASLCMAIAVYFAPLPCGSIVMEAVKLDGALQHQVQLS
jgi:hypothetical protein